MRPSLQLSVRSLNSAAGSPKSGSLTLKTLLLNDLIIKDGAVESYGERAAELRHAHDRLARDLIPHHEGREIDKAGGFLLLFERPLMAVRYALAYHEAVAELARREDVELAARVGIHMGEVALREGLPGEVARGAKRLEIEGLAKNVAARLMSLCGPRQTLITRAVFDLGRRATVGAEGLPKKLRWVRHGHYVLKGVAEAVEVFEVGVAGRAPLRAPTVATKARRAVEGRWLRWLAAAAALSSLILAGLGVRWLWLQRKPSEPLDVVVPKTLVRTMEEGGNDLSLEARAVHDGILRALLKLQDVAMLEPSAEDTRLTSPVALSRALGADEVLSSELDCAETPCRIVLERIHGEDGSLLWSRRFPGELTSLLQLSLTVMDQTRSGYPEKKARRGAVDLQVKSGDYDRFLELKERYRTRRESGTLEVVLKELAELRQSSPRFLEAYEFETHFLAERFKEVRRPEDLEQAIDIAEQARELAPEDPRVLKALAKVYIAARKTAEGREVISVMRNLDPGDAEVLGMQARLLRVTGDLDEARALMQVVLERQPAWHHFANAANMDKAAGDLETARFHLEEMYARAPNNYHCMSRMAQFELQNGSLERAAALYEKIVARSPEETELTNLSVVYMILKRYDEAAEAARRVLELTPTSPAALLNLADAEKLRGNAIVAARFYESVLERISLDPAPDVLLAMKAQALAQLGHSEEAVEAIRNALQLFPEDPQVAYEAALVYCLIGGQTSALLHARRSLDAGIDLVWFDFAWFDPIRERLSGVGSSG